MKKTQCALWLVVCSALAVAGSTPAARAGTWEERMTQGKLAADLGDRRTAEELFSGLTADAATPEGVRAEALVRLGVVQRAMGKTAASTAAFQKAMQSAGRDVQVTRLLVLALTGVAPDRTRWATQWSTVQLVSKSGATDPHPSIQWPGPGPQGVRSAFANVDPVTFDLEDVPVVPFLFRLLVTWRPGRSGPFAVPGFDNWPETYQPPAAVQGLDFVIHSGVGGVVADWSRWPRLTVKASSVPWNDLFENVLASNGLGFVLEKNLLFIARVEDLGSIERVRGRTYGGPLINLHLLTADLVDGQPPHPMGSVLGLFHDITDFQLVPDANLQGYVTLRVSNRPAMEVLDLVLASHDLVATRTSAPDSTPGTTALRICKLADVGGEAVDLSALMRPASPHP